MVENFKAIISGGSRGIGHAIARLLASQNWDLAFYSKNPSSVAEAEKVLTNLGQGKIFAATVDAANKEQVQNFGFEALQFLGGCDVLINNAGIFIPSAISEEKDSIFEEIIQTNLHSAYYLTKILVPALTKSNRAHIFNISSIAGQQAYPVGGSYSVSKFALTGFSRALREELKPKKIRVTNISPGATLTDSWNGVELPSERFILPENIASLLYNIFQINQNAVVEEILVRPVDGDI